MTDDATLAAEAYAAGERLWQQGQPDAALASLLRAVALRPEHPNARNFAGWLLTTRHRHEAEALAQGLALLADAHAMAPAELRPLQNLVEALVGAGQRARALEFIDAALARDPNWAQAWNLRGWLNGVSEGAEDPKAALADFAHAVRAYAWFGDAHFNRGCLALQLGDEALAHRCFSDAILAGNCWRPAEAQLRLGELEARRGHLRRALGHLRRAAELDQAGRLSALLLPLVQACGGQLLQSGRYLLHALDEARRSASLEAHAEPPRPPSLRSLARHAQDLLAEIEAPALASARAAIAVIVDCAQAKQLLPQYADRSPTMQLELAAAAASTPEPLRRKLAALARQWTAAQRSLYDELIACEEADPEAPARASITAHAAARRWDAARLELEALPIDGDPALMYRAATAEALGERAARDGDIAAAGALLNLALRDHEWFTAGASCGGEAMARLPDIERLRARLGELAGSG
jgi:Tfp pilus assembly protein PilF